MQYPLLVADVPVCLETSHYRLVSLPGVARMLSAEFGTCKAQQAATTRAWHADPRFALFFYPTPHTVNSKLSTPTQVSGADGAVPLLVADVLFCPETSHYRLVFLRVLPDYYRLNMVRVHHSKRQPPGRGTPTPASRHSCSTTSSQPSRPTGGILSPTTLRCVHPCLSRTKTIHFHHPTVGLCLGS